MYHELNLLDGFFENVGSDGVYGDECVNHNWKTNQYSGEVNEKQVVETEKNEQILTLHVFCVWLPDTLAMWGILQRKWETNTKI